MKSKTGTKVVNNGKKMQIRINGVANTTRIRNGVTIEGEIKIGGQINKIIPHHLAAHTGHRISSIMTNNRADMEVKIRMDLLQRPLIMLHLHHQFPSLSSGNYKICPRS